METILLPPVAPAAALPGAAWGTHHLDALFFAAADRCVRTKLKAIHAGGFATITEPQLALFHHLDPGGMRLTSLAAQANLTKQSMIELVDRAEAMKLVERRPDPEDRRAKTVHLTSDAGQLLASLRAGIQDAEREVREAFGAPFLEEARHRLDGYAADGEGPPIAGVADGDTWRLHNVGRMFAMSGRRLSREALAVAHKRGWRSVREVSLTLYRNLPLEGSRLTEIAAAARITKQSMRELIDRAELLGLVRRRPDPGDGRAKTIVFTPDGLAMLDDVRAGLDIAERRFAQATGEAFASALRERLQAYAAAPPARETPAEPGD